MIRSIYIVNCHGEVIVERHWCGNVRRVESELFWKSAGVVMDPSQLAPVLAWRPPSTLAVDGAGESCSAGSASFVLHIFRENLFFVATTTSSLSAPALVLAFLHHVVDILHSYFGEVNEFAIKEHFVTVYELLDEMLDSGFPLTTDVLTLKELLPPPSVYNKVLESVTGESSMLKTPRPEFTSARHGLIPWRKTDVKYTSNAIYIDLVESIDVTVDVDGRVLHQLVRGQVLVNSALSGMPDIVLRLSRNVVLDDISLHPCVRYARYEREGVLSFVPPDGAFTLMDYICRATSHPHVLPVTVLARCSPEPGTTNSWRWNLSVSASALAELNEVRVLIPLPSDVDQASCSVSMGAFSFQPTRDCASWDVGTLKRGSSATLTGTMASPRESKPLPLRTPTIILHFKAPLYSMTELMVDELQILNERYQPFKGMKRTAVSGRCTFRSSNSL